MCDSNLHTDEHLLCRFQLGDKKAFEAIYYRYVGKLYTYARKNIASKEDCEEIIQDIFVSLWKRHQELGHLTALAPYLFSMVRYKVIRYFQHEKVKQRYAEHFRLFEAMYDTVIDGEEEQLNSEALIERRLASLPARCREAVTLRLREQLTNTDIARRMKISKTTVENYMVMALKHFRSLGKEALE